MEHDRANPARRHRVPAPVRATMCGLVVQITRAVVGTERNGRGEVDVMHTCQIAVDASVGRTAVVRVAGELAIASAARLGRVLDRVAAGGISRVVVDLANVRWFDPAAVGALDHTRRRLGDEGVVMVLVGLDDRRAALPGRIGDAIDRFSAVREVGRVVADDVRA